MISIFNCPPHPSEKTNPSDWDKKIQEAEERFKKEAEEPVVSQSVGHKAAIAAQMQSCDVVTVPSFDGTPEATPVAPAPSTSRNVARRPFNPADIASRAIGAGMPAAAF